MASYWSVSVVADVCEEFCESRVENRASFPQILHGAFRAMPEADEVRDKAVEMFSDVVISSWASMWFD